MTEEVQELQLKAAEAKRELVRLENEEKLARRKWDQVQQDLNKARETLNRAEFVMHSTPGASPEIPVPSYEEMLRMVAEQSPDLSHQERIAMVGLLRSGFAGSNIGANFNKSHGQPYATGDVEDVSAHSHNIPSAAEIYGPIGQKKNYG
jgi:hypothetical protein